MIGMSGRRFVLLLLMLACGGLSAVTVATTSQGAAQQLGSPPTPPPGGGRGRGGIPVMTLTSPAWADGTTIPVKYTQAGDETSPPFSWSGAPAGVASFVLIAHDLDAAIGNGTDDILHWMLWNIPPSTTSLPEQMPAVAQLPDGTRQVGATGPGYRGPGAPAAGPRHHYVFELYALDAMLDIATVTTPAQTRAAVVAAMAGHVRAKSAYVGLFKRT